MSKQNMKVIIKKPSRQRRWQNKRLADGKCVRCGASRTLYAQRCDECQAEETKRSREKNGCGEWKAGGRGRKPKCNQIAA